MAATTTAPRVPPSKDSMAARYDEQQKADVTRTKPVVHKLTGALDDAGCLIERLGALYSSNAASLQEVLESELPDGLRDRLYQIWMIYTLAGEKLEEVDELIAVITEKAYAARMAVAA